MANGDRAAGALERIGTATDVVRFWMIKAWRIGVMMAKGAYLLGERRRLFLRLGEEAYSRLQAGTWSAPELESILKQVERVSKKIEIEEMLIRNARYGTKTSRPRAASSEAAAEPTPPATTGAGNDAGKGES